MKTAIAHLRSTTPYSQSRYHDTEKKPKEQPQAWEERTWKNRLHINRDGQVFIPPMAFKKSIFEAAQFLSEKIKGKQGTYTKHFKAGVMVIDGPTLPDDPKQIGGEWFNMDAQPGRGSGKGTRVPRCYPVIPTWSAAVTFYIMDDIITEEVFAETLKAAGTFIGIGRFRPINGGYYGRFVVDKIEWSESIL